MLGNPERPVGGLAVRLPAGVELLPLGRDDLGTAVAMAREQRGLPALGDVERLRERYMALIGDPDVIAYLAVSDGRPVGLCVMHLRRRLNFATFEGWIPDLHVTAAEQDVGVASAMLQALIAEWRLRGGHRILCSVRDDAPGRAGLLHDAGFDEGFVDFRQAPPRPPAVRPVAGLRIRPLADGDADAVTRLIAEFGLRRSPVPDRMEAVLRTYAAHARQVALRHAGSLIAELEDVTVGACTLEWQRPFWTTDLHAWIGDLVVTEPVRGRGIGRALLAAALQSAEAAGAAEVRLESGPQRVAARGLYVAAGFGIVGRTWVLRADEPGP